MTTLETEEWLVWLGVKEPQVNLSEIVADLDRLKDSVGTWSDFQDLVSNSADYSELENNLLNAGFPSDKVDAFISKIQDQYASYSDFQDAVVNTLTSYEEFQAQFGNQQGLTGSELTEDGEPTAGIRVHDSAGTSYDGVSVPGGTTEVFGKRIEFSQQGAAAIPDDVTYSNFTTDPGTTVQPLESITFSADVTNPNGWGIDVTVPLKEDGNVISQIPIRLGANATQTVEFTVTKENYVCFDYSIGSGTGTITACWTAAGLI